MKLQGLLNLLKFKLMHTVNISRFIQAQEECYEGALAEIKSGRKTGHWMWFIFPQIKGLGNSENSIYYGIDDINEALEYVNHPILGTRLVQMSQLLLNVPTDDPEEILGHIDSLKLKSSMTLFAELPDANTVFQSVLDKFFDGQKDMKTLNILNSDVGYITI
jgi:uncharacterized protein (DUF1810 family)